MSSYPTGWSEGACNWTMVFHYLPIHCAVWHISCANNISAKWCTQVLLPRYWKICVKSFRDNSDED